jgi:hypothetical protein
VEAWKGAVARAERDLVRVGCALAAVDLMAALAACFAPPLSPVLGLARLAGLVVFVPALLRTLAIRHADREDAELMKAIAVAVGAAAGYLVVRTWVVVRVCSL